MSNNQQPVESQEEKRKRLELEKLQQEVTSLKRLAIFRWPFWQFILTAAISGLTAYFLINSGSLSVKSDLISYANMKLVDAEKNYTQDTKQYNVSLNKLRQDSIRLESKIRQFHSDSSSLKIKITEYNHKSDLLEIEIADFTKQRLSLKTDISGYTKAIDSLRQLQDKLNQNLAESRTMETFYKKRSYENQVHNFMSSRDSARLQTMTRILVEMNNHKSDCEYLKNAVQRMIEATTSTGIQHFEP